jgi:hypothetical protein
MANAITSTTAKNMILDAGVVYVNYGETNERILGATEGGNSFTIERDFQEIAVDGAKGKIKGLMRLVAENASLAVNMREFSTANLLAALPGTVKAYFPAVTPTHDSITSTGSLSDSSYLTNIALVSTVSGSNQPCVIILTNAIADGKFEFKAKDKDAVTLEVTFSATYDPADLDTVPYEIRYPKMA